MEENNSSRYRHEQKYVISAGEMALLQNRLNHLLQKDMHTDSSGMYNIRSLYFDDYHNRCFYENENGNDIREKFRIRIYNHSSDRIVLECKKKVRDRTLKLSCPLTVEQTKALMSGKVLPDIGGQPPLLQKFTCQMLQHGLRPVVVVEYDRIPYVYEIGNVRVTLDMNISSSGAIGNFLDERIPKRPIMPAGRQLLEVKYDEFLPGFVHDSLQLRNMTRTAYSKYYLCRKFTR